MFFLCGAAWLHSTTTLSTSQVFRCTPTQSRTGQPALCTRNYVRLMVKLYPRGDSNPHHSITLNILRRYVGYSGKCLNCGEETRNPKFCSRSCAASFNNSRPDVNRNRLTGRGICLVCKIPVRVRRKYCDEHKPIQLPRLGRKLDKSVNSNTGNSSAIRAMARSIYRLSGRPAKCILCGYYKHVDICHIKDVRSYPDGTLYEIINDQSNLIALCRNHHWEFDHDLL